MVFEAEEEIPEISAKQMWELLLWMNAEDFLDHSCDCEELQTIMDDYHAWKRGY